MHQFSQAFEVLSFFDERSCVYRTLCDCAVCVCVCVFVSVCIIYTCRSTHIDAYTWGSLWIANGKVSLWIVMVNLIKSTCSFDSWGIFTTFYWYQWLGLFNPFFCLEFVGIVPILTKSLMMFSIIIRYLN